MRTRQCRVYYPRDRAAACPYRLETALSGCTWCATACHSTRNSPFRRSSQVQALDAGVPPSFSCPSLPRVCLSSRSYFCCLPTMSVIVAGVSTALYFRSRFAVSLMCFLSLGPVLVRHYFIRHFARFQISYQLCALSFAACPKSLGLKTGMFFKLVLLTLR